MDTVCTFWICGAPSRPPRRFDRAVSRGALDNIDKAFVKTTSDEYQASVLEEFGVDPFEDLQDVRFLRRRLAFFLERGLVKNREVPRLGVRDELRGTRSSRGSVLNNLEVACTTCAHDAAK